jgi:DNA-binding response OmpR family regulator
MTKTLRAAGYCVFEAYDTHAGHELALMVPVGLLILDASPDSARVALVHRVAQHRPEVPVLHVVPDGASPGVLKELATLVWPFSGERLLAAVRQLLARASPASPARIGQDVGDSARRPAGADALV